MVNGWDFLAGIPWALSHDLISLVVCLESKSIFSFAFYNGVVVSNRFLEIFNRHVQFLGQFIKSWSRNDTA